jgi:sporulation protein YlmC with PRC-barrel domain
VHVLADQFRDRLAEFEEHYAAYQLYDSDGEKIGSVDDLFVDDNDDLKYIGVKVEHSETRSILIPMDAARVDEERRVIEVVQPKRKVHEGPTFDDEKEITLEFEEQVRDHYGLRSLKSSVGRDEGQERGHTEREEGSESGPDTVTSVDEEPRSEEEGRARASERQSERVNVRKRMRSDQQRRTVPNLPVDESEGTAEEVLPTTDVPPRTKSSLSRPAPASGEAPTGDAPPRTAQSWWEPPPPRPRRATPAETAPPSEDATRPEQRRRNHRQRDAAAVIGILVMIVLLLLAWWWGFSPSDEEALEEQPISPKQQEEVPRDQPEDKEAPKERVLPQEEEAESPLEEASPLPPIEEEGLPVEEGLPPEEVLLLPGEGQPLPEEGLPQ